MGWGYMLYMLEELLFKEGIVENANIVNNIFVKGYVML